MRRVSVLMLSYNQRPYVEQAVEGFLRQDLGDQLSAHLIVGDDCSTDGTTGVLRDLAARHADRITLIDRPANIGIFGNYADLWARADGDYIAPLEGDDYWTRPDKLHRQVAAMDANPDWSMSFHRARLVDASGADDGRTAPDEQWLSQGIDLANLARANQIPTASVMYRHGVVPEIPQWLRGLGMLDWPLNLLHAGRGRIGFVDLEACAYRLHAGGVWTGQTEAVRLRSTVEVIDALLDHEIAPGARPNLRALRSKAREDLSALADSAGDRPTARREFTRSLSDRPLDRSRLRRRARTFAHFYVPRLVVRAIRGAERRSQLTRGSDR